MRQLGEWGGHVELSAAATLLHTTIYTFHEDTSASARWRRFRPLFKWTAGSVEEESGWICLRNLAELSLASYRRTPAQPSIYLDNTSSVHYNVILDVGFNSVTRSEETLVAESPGVYQLEAVVSHYGSTVRSGISHT